MEFSNQTVVVTGAAGNLGRAVVNQFADSGANLVLVGLRKERLTERFGRENDRQLFVAADLGEQGPATAVAEAAVARFGHIDVLCNLAGGFRMGEPVHATSDETWQFLFDLNAHSVLHMVRAVVPRMLARGGGKIVNVGAYAARKGVANMGAYCASKAVVIRLTESMAAELRERNINVNCVLPTVIDTPENRRSMPDADPSRWVAPDDLARIIVFLASPAARAIHGAAIPVTGLS
ncbi:MAG: SDR family oxidoreductase [Pseudomonadota bacterium]|nr:SDR family oxidoreductase [Pseudomonadota bacterium]